VSCFLAGFSRRWIPLQIAAESGTGSASHQREARERVGLGSRPDMRGGLLL
jgi:hypothetical protein